MKKENKKNVWNLQSWRKGTNCNTKDARDMFNIKPGDSLILLGDKNKGMALIKAEVFESFTDNVLGDLNDNN